MSQQTLSLFEEEPVTPRLWSACPKRIIELAAPLKPTPVFCTYWYFAAERQNILFRRLDGASPPWTSDPILQQYRFTNAYRVCDRASQYLLRHVLHDRQWSDADLFFRCILFKIFNKPETWEFLRNRFGEPRVETFSLSDWDRALAEAMARGMRIYSPAYIMPSGGKDPAFGGRKHAFHLNMLHDMLAAEMPARVRDAHTLEEVFQMLRAWPGLGDFLAFQYTIDLNYSPLLNFDESDFVVAGPGAKSGIRKCFEDNAALSPRDIIDLVTERQAQFFEALGIEFRTLYGRPLQPIDCQNLFCEVDKYARVRHPNLQGDGNRKRIKRSYQGPNALTSLFLPPKWHRVPE